MFSGIVEVFKRREFSGWIATSEGQETLCVDLYVDSFKVASTWAAQKSNRRTSHPSFEFRFSISDLWKYVKRKDKITLQVGGQILPILGKGTYYHPRQDGAEQISELMKKINSGYTFDQRGRLSLSKQHDKKWQDLTFNLYDKTSEFLAENHDYKAFICYGTLLGFAREGNLIGHDLDFDCAFISKKSVGEECAQELVNIASSFIKAGFDVVGKRTCLKISHPEFPETAIDLFHLFYDAEDDLKFAFGVASTSKLNKKDIKGVERSMLCKREVYVPQPVELFAKHTYGDSWRLPNPGFSWRLHRKQSERSSILKPSQVEEIYWANFYATAEFHSGSTFSNWVGNLGLSARNVVDIGCGDGRDSVMFARDDNSVLALDRSHIAVEHATAYTKKNNLNNLQFLAIDVNDTDSLTNALSLFRKDSPGPLIFYMRFFLHSLTEEGQANLFKGIEEVSESGDFLCAEFRTDKDEAKTKIHGNHFRRFQPLSTVQSALDEMGFLTMIEQEGNGFSPYKGEDPYLGRIVASKH